MPKQKGVAMAAAKFNLRDVNGSESPKNVTAGLTLGDLLKSGQQGLIGGEVMAANTSIRRGDHVEIIPKSGKAGR